MKKNSSTKTQVIPDNSHCVDCGSVHPQWVSINNAVYVCYNCSGIHRGFGVQISFIRSLSMDALTDKQTKVLSLGGNKRFLEFMEAYGLENEPSNIKYKTKAAEFYRNMLKAMSEGKNYTEAMPELDEGRKFIKGFEEYGKKPMNYQDGPKNMDRYSTDNAGYGGPAKKVQNDEGFLDKVVGAAKDFGQITKSAAGVVWEKSKALKVFYDIVKKNIG